MANEKIPPQGKEEKAAPSAKSKGEKSVPAAKSKGEKECWQPGKRCACAFVRTV